MEAAPPPPTLEELMEMPAMEAPPGITANFIDPPNQNGLAVAIITLTMVIATICLLLRAYARLWLLRKVQIEEFLIFAAYGVYIGQTYCSYNLIGSVGYFVHQYNMKMKQLEPAGFDVLLIGSFYQTILPLLKTAILTEWLRIFAPANRTKSVFWWGCVSIITLQVVWGVVCVILLNVQCTPHEAIWKFYLPRECYNLVPVQLTSGSVQLFSDIVMLMLPQKVIWGLNLNWKKKIGVSVIFSLGILACISAAFRLAVTVNYGYDPDQMYTLGPVVFWVMAETTCGFFISCMPIIPKILDETGAIRKIKASLGLTKDQYGSGNGGLGNTTGGHSKKYGTGVASLSRTTATVDAYHKLDEEVGVALGNYNTSQEQLRQPGGGGMMMGRKSEDQGAGSRRKIVRTMTVQVTADTASASHSETDLPSSDPARWR